MNGITTSLTSGSNNAVSILMLKRRGGYRVRITAIARISLAAGYAACGRNFISKSEGVTGSGDLCAIAVVTYGTGINYATVGSTSSSVSCFHVGVTGRGSDNVGYNVAATNTYAGFVFVCRTSAVNVSPSIIVSPRLTSFSRCESGYCIGGEVVCFEAYKAVSISCLDRLNSVAGICTLVAESTFIVYTLICDEPNNDTVNVLAG